MTEKELRRKVISIFESWLGHNERTGEHRKIIDLYNSHKPLARNYVVQYDDEWCATAVSACFIKAGLTDIAPTECGCGEMIRLHQKLGTWMERDDYVPKPGDIIMYHWKDDGKGDCTGWPNHVGVVVSALNGVLKVIEGNKGESVAYRALEVNGRYIRGYCCPDYSKKASEGENFQVGDIVNFTGTEHYFSSNSADGKACKPGKAQVTALASTGRHPVHLVAVAGAGSNVYGWVDTACIARESVSLAVGAKVTVKAGATTYEGKALKSFVYKTTYDVLRIDGDRVVIGLGSAVTAAVHQKDLTVV